MNYNEARLKIKTGDLIAVREAHGLIGEATQFFTKSPYTHTGLAEWKEDGLWMAELNGGRNHAIPLSQLEYCQFDVYEPPPQCDRGKLSEAISFWLRVKINYGFLAFIAIGLLNFFNIKKFVKWRNILVCSGFCVAIYERAGWTGISRIISPGELASNLTLKFRVNS